MINDQQIVTVLKEMEEFENKFKARFAIDEQTGNFLYNLVFSKSPKKILELGTWRGASAIYLAAALKEIGSGHILTVDVGNDRVHQAKQNFIKAGVDQFITQQISDIGAYLKHDQTIYDLIFLDATKHEQSRWIKKLLNHNVTSGSLIIVDDIITMKEKMSELLKFVTKDKRIESNIEDVGDGLLIIGVK